MRHNASQRLNAFGGSGCFAHQNQRRGTVRNRRSVGGGNGTVFGEGWTQGRNFLDVSVERLLILLNQGFTFATNHFYRHDFGFVQAFLNRFFSTGERQNGVFVHLLTGVAFFVGHFLSESTHQFAGFGILQAIEEHMILRRAAGAHTETGANPFQHIGCVGHGFHAAGHNNLYGTGFNGIVGQHGGFHAGATQLIDGGCAGSIR